MVTVAKRVEGRAEKGSRGRKSKVDSSPHADEIFHLLMEQRWGADSVAKYLELKHGEEISPGTLRTWRIRQKELLVEAGTLPECWDDPEESDRTAKAEVKRLTSGDHGLPDVLSRRFALIRLQEARIRLDAEHEFSMQKQFVSQGKEIDLLNRLYNDAKRDMQELGLWPSAVAAAGTQVNVNAYGGVASAVAGAAAEARSEVSSTPIEELLEGVDVSAIREVGAVMKELGV
jgi:hypothetical protein